MDNLRREQLTANWENECGGDQGWREDLTPVELDFIARMDCADSMRTLAMASSIPILEKIRARFRPSEILELETFSDHCRLRLRGGGLFLARLNADHSLRLDEIEEVC